MNHNEPKSMLEKLTEHYLWGLQIKADGGHAVGFYREKPENVLYKYSYPTGIFTLRKKTGDFFMWNYDPFPYLFSENVENEIPVEVDILEKGIIPDEPSDIFKNKP